MTSRLTTQLKDEVEAILRRDSWLKNFPIEVIENNGVIILDGEVPSEAISSMAENLVRQVDGVVSVSNELYVKPRH